MRSSLFAAAVLLLLSFLALPVSAQDADIPDDGYLVLPGSRPDAPVIAANDNREIAGSLTGDTRHVNLVVGRGLLYPEDESQPGLWVEAIGESSDQLAIPAPLLRFQEGQMLSVTLRNELPDSSITWFGLHTRPISEPDSVVLAPGESITRTVAVGAPGTYLYRARIGFHDAQSDERDLTAGAFIVDPKGEMPDDRVFVMNIWSRTDSTLQSGGYNTLMINGKSWPHTERIMADVGISERWHVVNASRRNHPMHLHGFYFELLSFGNLASSEAIPVEDRREFVTQTLRGHQTMLLDWTPRREGDWLFHCHLSFHVSDMNRLPGSDHGHAHMAGLVMGISVRPGASDLIEQGADRHLTLTITQSADDDRFAFRLDDSAFPGEPTFSDRGPMLELRQYQPTYVTVVNQSNEPTGIHWHGLELDAWADGVPGFSASHGRVSPTIAADSSFTYKLTLMRPGTFMYHTHLNDISQLARGMYGPITVLPPEGDIDRETDHSYILGWRAFEPQGPQDAEINGIAFTEEQPEITTKTGTTHTLRVMNIAAAGNMTLTMYRGEDIVPVTLIEKDGAELPDHLKRSIDRLPRLFIGETSDVAFTPTEPGTYTLHIGYGGPFMAKQTWHVE